jgi:hypothetical protein
VTRQGRIKARGLELAAAGKTPDEIVAAFADDKIKVSLRSAQRYVAAAGERVA